MSRAFVREQDHPSPEPLRERPVSPHPNYVTSRGLALIDAELARLDAALERADAEEAPRLQRDLRYWAGRRASAQVIEPPADPEEIAFGSRVTVRRDGGPPETIEIVGEDESEPTLGRIGWTAPLARALIGAAPGDIVDVGPRQPPIEIEILAVDNRG